MHGHYDIGLALPLLALLAPFGVSVAAGALLTPGDAGRTAHDILVTQGLFRWGIASLILFGVQLLLIGYLAYRSGFMPKIFGILLVVAGLGYLVDGFLPCWFRSP